MTQSTISPVARTLGIDVTVTAVIDETPEARTIVLDFPAGTDYRPGQFITVRIPSDRTGPVARSYSLSTAPNVDASPAITVKRTRGGYGSNWLCDNAEPGLVLHILPPSGVFTPRSWEGPLYLFAAGSGVTPVMSILRSALAEHDTDVVLFYANRDHESTIFASAIDELTARHPAPDREPLARNRAGSSHRGCGQRSPHRRSRYGRSIHLWPSTFHGPRRAHPAGTRSRRDRFWSERRGCAGCRRSRRCWPRSFPCW